jgi:hypothetical protein
MLAVSGPIDELDPPPQLTTATTDNTTAAITANTDTEAFRPFGAKESLQRIGAPLMELNFVLLRLLLDRELGDSRALSLALSGKGTAVRA